MDGSQILNTLKHNEDLSTRHFDKDLYISFYK